MCVDPMMGKQTDHIFSPAEFTGHDHPRLVRVNITTVVEQVVVRLVVVEENHRDTSGADVHNLAYQNPRSEISPSSEWNSTARYCLPYCLLHSVTRSQSSLVVRLSAFPINGRGLGPGGSFLAAALWVRASTERVATAPASVTIRKSTVITNRDGCER